MAIPGITVIPTAAMPLFRRKALLDIEFDIIKD
jgi:hypothetical protein